jgi:hypothetical protein
MLSVQARNAHTPSLCKEKPVKKSLFIALFSLLATVAVAAQETPSAKSAPNTAIAVPGKELITANGAHLGEVYRVGPDGSPQIILDGKFVTVPATSLSNVDGKLTTSLTKTEVRALSESK